MKEWCRWVCGWVKLKHHHSRDLYLFPLKEKKNVLRSADDWYVLYTNIQLLLFCTDVTYSPAELFSYSTQNISTILLFKCAVVLSGVFTPSLLLMTLADTVSVHPGENITLICNIANYSDIFWYRLESEEVKLLLSAKKGTLETHFKPFFSVDEHHIDVTNDSSLLIIRVNQSDSGFYYCVSQDRSRVVFGKPITLNCTGACSCFILFFCIHLFQYNSFR